MGQQNLNRILSPRNIAVVGASEKTGTIGNALMQNLVAGKFPGAILPVNPKYSQIHGYPACQSVRDLENGVDLAIIATPIQTVTELIRDCIKKEIGGAIVISAGGKETGAEGLKIEKEIREAALPTEFRIIGPNCLGVMRPGVKLNATFADGMVQPGHLAFVSQSGGVCSAILDLALKEHIGFSHFVSIGSMLDVDFGDMIDYLGNDPAVKSILLYIEQVTNSRKFMSAARAVSRVKPIIVLKAGRSAAGARAAAYHTGALIGEDEIYDAAFKRAGIVRVDTIQELFDCAELLAKQPRPRGPRLAIITNGGGPGVMAADFLVRNGYEPAALRPETCADLDTMLPPYWSHNNPIDLLGDASPERVRNVLEICLRTNEFDGVLVILLPQAMTPLLPVAETLASVMLNNTLPILTCLMGGTGTEQASHYLNDAGIPTFDTPERAIQTFLHLVTFTKNQELLLEVVPKLTKDVVIDRNTVQTFQSSFSEEGFLPEGDVRQLLTAYGLPVIRTETAGNSEEASLMSRSIGYPVVMKLDSLDIVHKTEAGGVCLDLRSDWDVRKAYQEIIQGARRYKKDSRFSNVTIQPYLAQADFEILLGAKRDRDFGPVILFGIGGIFTEIIRDKALGLPPMNRLLARRLMQQSKAYTLLQGYRNRPAADFELLEAIIIRLSQILIDLPNIAELDMNPVIIRNGKPVIVDARIRIAPTSVPAPRHLVISPYPGEHEYRVSTDSGMNVFIRPVKPEDAPLFIRLFSTLSPTSIYYRFFGVLKELPPEMLSRFTQIDYDREIALIAIDQDSDVELMLGVARIIGDPDGKEGEFAVLIGDSWQGKGIGAGLLRHCLLIAEKRGFKKIYGVVLKENKGMLALGRKLGFKMSKDEDSGEYSLQINFEQAGITEGLKNP